MSEQLQGQGALASWEAHPGDRLVISVQWQGGSCPPQSGSGHGSLQPFAGGVPGALMLTQHGGHAQTGGNGRSPNPRTTVLAKSEDATGEQVGRAEEGVRASSSAASGLAPHREAEGTRPPQTQLGKDPPRPVASFTPSLLPQAPTLGPGRRWPPDLSPGGGRSGPAATSTSRPTLRHRGVVLSNPSWNFLVNLGECVPHSAW